MGRNYPENLYTTVNYRVSSIDNSRMILKFKMGSFAEIDYLYYIGKFLVSLSNLDFDEALDQFFATIGDLLIGYDSPDYPEVVNILKDYTDTPPEDIAEALIDSVEWHQDLLMAERVKQFELTDLEKYKYFEAGSKLPRDWEFKEIVTLTDKYIMTEFLGDFLLKEDMDGFVFYIASAYYVAESVYVDSPPMTDGEIDNSSCQSSSSIWGPGEGIDGSASIAGGRAGFRNNEREVLIAGRPGGGYDIGYPIILCYAANGRNQPEFDREWGFDIFPAPMPSNPLAYDPGHWSVDTNESYALRTADLPEGSEMGSLFNTTDDIFDRWATVGWAAKYGKLRGKGMRWSGRGSGGTWEPPKGVGPVIPPIVVTGTGGTKEGGGERGKPFSGSPLGGLLSVDGFFGIKLIKGEEEE